MSCIAKKSVIALIFLALPVAACAGQHALVGSDGSSAGAPSNAGESNSSLSYTLMGPLNFGKGKCLPEPIAADATCKVLTTRSGSGCSCSEPGLTPSTNSVNDAMRVQLQLAGYCGLPGQAPCSDSCACEVSRAIGTSLIECQTLPEPSPDSAGWCYVSAAAGEPQTELVADCPSSQQQRLRFVGDPSLLSAVPSFLACLDGGQVAPARALVLGEVCIDEFSRTNAGFSGHSINEVNIEDHSTVCSSGTCVVNRFQGLVNCPYGQAAGAGDCLLPGSNEAVSVAVQPQLVERQAAVASICSCHCDGTGPGPYCTCPESMQCEHLVDDLGLGDGQNLSGSYCIPKGSAYDPSAPRTACVEPNCGVKHPY